MKAAVVLLVGLFSAAPEEVQPASISAELESSLEALGPLEVLRLGGGRALTLDGLLDGVQRNHPRLLAARAKLEAGRGEALAASGAYDPRIVGGIDAQPVGGYENAAASIGINQLSPWWGMSFEGTYRASTGELPIYKLEKETLEAGELAFGVRLPLLRDGPIDSARARTWRTEALTEMLEAERQSAELDLLREAGGQYFAWVAAARQYEVALSWYELSERRDAQIRKMAAEGALPEVERLDNLRAMLSRRDTVLDAQRRVERTAISLSFYHREADGQPRVPTSDSVPPSFGAWGTAETPLDEALKLARARRPELVALESARAQLEIDLRLANNQILPKLELSLDLSKDLGPVAGPRGDKLEPFAMIAGAKLELPVLFREGRGQRDRTSARLREQIAAIQIAEDRILQEVRDAHSALSVAQERRRVLELSARTALAVANGEWRRFELGASSILNVNLREQASAAAQVALVDAEAEVARAFLAYSLALYDPRVLARGRS